MVLPVVIYCSRFSTYLLIKSFNITRCLNCFSCNFCASIAGKQNLGKADLESALKALKDRLMTKNVVGFTIEYFPLFPFFIYANLLD